MRFAVHRCYRLVFLCCALVCAGALPGAAASTQTGSTVLRVGVVPQQSASQLARTWTPLLQAVEQDAGLRLQFKTAKDIPTFEQRLAAGEYDLAYMNPYHYTVFSASVGYRALVTEQGRRLQGIVVVRKDSRYRDIGALRGQQVAFPSPAAFAASVLPSQYMIRHGVTHEPVYVASHDSVYLAVAKGLYPAGGGIVRTFDSMDPSVREQLRVLWITPQVMAHPIAVHPRVAPGDVARLRAAWVALSTTPPGKSLLQAAGFQGFVEVQDHDYDAVRDMDIRLLDQYLED